MTKLKVFIAINAWDCHCDQSKPLNVKNEIFECQKLFRLTGLNVSITLVWPTVITIVTSLRTWSVAMTAGPTSTCATWWSRTVWRVWNCLTMAAVATQLSHAPRVQTRVLELRETDPSVAVMVTCMITRVRWERRHVVRMWWLQIWDIARQLNIAMTSASELGWSQVISVM